MPIERKKDSFPVHVSVFFFLQLTLVLAVRMNTTAMIATET